MRAVTPIYLDNAATTRPTEEVVQAMAEAALSAFGNPSSAHHFAAPAKKRLEDARQFLRGSLGAADVIFTSGGTEADLLGIVGAVQDRAPGRVLCSATDHPAILALAPRLMATRHRLEVLPTTGYGDLDPEVLFDKLGKDVRCLALMYGHNELGTLCNLPELVSITRRVAPEAHIHVDLVQSYGKVAFDLDHLDVDSVAVAGHKFHGPRGAGFLACSSKARIAPLQAGGGQESGLRGGTENVPGAVGLATAAEQALSTLGHSAQHTSALASQLCAGLAEALPGLQRLGHPERRLPHILSLRLPGVTASTLLERCSAKGLAFSTGAACHGSKQGNNPVLQAIGLKAPEAREVARFSFCRHNTSAEIDAALLILQEELANLRRVAPKRPKTPQSHS